MVYKKGRGGAPGGGPPRKKFFLSPPPPPPGSLARLLVASPLDSAPTATPLVLVLQRVPAHRLGTLQTRTGRVINIVFRLETLGFKTFRVFQKFSGRSSQNCLAIYILTEISGIFS